jgi:hypothetical protein
MAMEGVELDSGRGCVFSGFLQDPLKPSTLTWLAP